MQLAFSLVEQNVRQKRRSRDSLWKFIKRNFNKNALEFFFCKWKTMMAIVHARGVARVYEESIEADLRGKYVIIDKLEDRVDELSDIETSQSIRLAQLEGNNTLRRKRMQSSNLCWRRNKKR